MKLARVCVSSSCLFLLAVGCGSSNNAGSKDSGGGQDGGGQADASMDQGPDADPTVVTVTWVDNYVSDSGIEDVTGDFSTMPIKIWTFNGTDYDMHTGTPSGAGTIKFTGMPPTGNYMLEQDSAPTTFIVTSARNVNLGIHIAGRSDSVKAKSFNTALSFSVTGLTAFGKFDELELVSSNTGAWASIIQITATNPPMMGDTSTSGMKLQWAGEPLLDGSAGDSATLSQMQWTPAASLGYLKVINTFTTDSGFSMTEARNTLATGAMSPVADSTSAVVNWKMADMNALTPAVNPTAQAMSQDLSIVAVPGGTALGLRRPFGSLVSIVQAQSPSDIDFGTINYGNPYPSDWGVVGSYDMTYAMIYKLGTARGTVLGASVSHADAIANLTGKPWGVALSPPQNIKVDGKDVMTGTPTGISVMPKITWDAPAVGTPTYYLVTLYDVIESGGNTSLGYIGFFGTPENQLIVPQGLVTGGKTYILKITAGAEPNRDEGAHPYRTTLPASSADALSVMWGT